jgi:hypothetical protein
MRMLKLLPAILFTAIAAPALAQEADSVCLVTFATAEAAAAGADDTALSGVYLPRSEAETLAAASGGLAGVWDYSATYPTNAEEQAFCEGPTFNPDDDGEAAGNPNSARAFAPGQLKGEGESARDHAPGQNKEPGESARDEAPGQQKKGE